MYRNKCICFLIALLFGVTCLFCACGKITDETKPTEYQLPEGIMQKEDPADDGIINLLMIGNSYCYSYVDELYGIAKAAGIEMRICNVYYSGCSIAQHWSWWKSGDSNYEFCTFDASGRKAEGRPIEGQGVNLAYCLSQYNWDIISLHEAVCTVRTDAEAAFIGMNNTLPELLGYIQEQYPLSKMFWQQTWAYQVGFEQSGYQVSAVDVQTQLHENIRKMSLNVCEKYGFQRVPSGDAWQMARANAVIGDTLCERLSGTDFHHEGDVGGGQYLNACVWYEVITGQSCIGNTYRPDYDLSNEKIDVLQNAAHQAVENMKSEQ